MESAVLERDYEFLAERARAAEAGDELAAGTAFLGIVQAAGHLTRWQWVVQGETKIYRQGVCKALCRDGKFEKALKCATCGRGDQVVREPGGSAVRVQAHGCGCRFCPRCSRRGGRRMLKRISEHLASAPHGAMDHYVLTQRAATRESVGDARARWDAAWKQWYPYLRISGMRSALLTIHVKPRVTGGWHYHGHLVVEWKEGVNQSAAYEALNAKWQEAIKSSADSQCPVFSRGVCPAGEAIPLESFGSQGEFWAEPESAVARVLQYALRDVLQGCEAWVEDLTSDAVIAQFVAVMGHVKLHRTFGVWRKAAAVEADDEDEVVEEEESASDSPKKVGGQWVKLGTVGAVLKRAFGGDSDMVAVVTALSACIHNNGRVGKRWTRMVTRLGSSV